MDLDKIYNGKYSLNEIREIVNFVKRHCIKCKQNYSRGNFRAGLWYEWTYRDSGFTILSIDPAYGEQIIFELAEHKNFKLEDYFEV